jgi:hypothetical protein
MFLLYFDIIGMGKHNTKSTKSNRFRKNRQTKRKSNKYSQYQHKKNKTMKKMNCSPFVKKTPVKNSCLPEDILITIKKEYNAHHPENPIKTNHFTKIWHELKNRLDCKREDCWLKEIRDKQLRKEIDELIFAPDQPPEWKNNPDEWLSNYDIIDVLKQYEKTYKYFKFIEPTPIDFDDTPPDMYGSCVTKELCNFDLSHYIKNKIRKIGIIFNLDKHNESGSHWVSLFIDLEDKFILYFDSAADIIQPEIEELVNRILEQGSQIGIDFQYEKDNNPFEHQMGNTECGMYSLYFIITLLTGKTGENKLLKGYDDKKHYFNSIRIPDEYVFKRRNIYFNSGGEE